MEIISQVRLSKSLEIAITLCLFGFSLWFSRDVWSKFQSKATNFKQSTSVNTGKTNVNLHLLVMNKENKKSLFTHLEVSPTTVICFSPFLKKNCSRTIEYHFTSIYLYWRFNKLPRCFTFPIQGRSILQDKCWFCALLQ